MAASSAVKVLGLLCRIVLKRGAHSAHVLRAIQGTGAYLHDLPQCVMTVRAADTDLQDAAVQRCVRQSSPPLIVGGTYQHLSKIDDCVNDGLNALKNGTPAPDVADMIVDCVNGNSFPDPLKPTVDNFTDCIKSHLS